MVSGGSSKSKETNNKNKKYSQSIAIYCHQCRRRTKDMDLIVTCKNRNGIKPCPLKFCGNCLLKSYGDKPNEIGLLSEWICPRCRGVCLCSVCRKKRGEKEVLSRVVSSAKSVGVGSVSATINGLKRKKAIPLSNDVRVSPRVQRKKASFDKPNEESEKSLAKKQKMEGLVEEVKNDIKDNDAPKEPEKTIIIAEKPEMDIGEEGWRNDVPKVSEEEDVEIDGDTCLFSEEIQPEKPVSNEVLFCHLTRKGNEVERDVEENKEILDHNNGDERGSVVETEIPQPHQGNFFRWNAVKLFRWFVGSA